MNDKADQFLSKNRHALRGVLNGAIRVREERLMKLAMNLPSDRYPQSALDQLTRSFSRSLGECREMLAFLDEHYPDDRTDEEMMRTLDRFDEAFGAADEDGRFGRENPPD